MTSLLSEASISKVCRQSELLSDLSAARLPALHTLNLSGIFVPWDSAILQNLRVLRLSRWEVSPSTFDEMYHLPADRFLHALAACQLLEELSMDLLNTNPHIQLAIGRLPTISLPNLRQMELRVNQFESNVIFLLILSHIRFPETCSIVLEGSTIRFDLEPPSYAKFLPNNPQCFPTLANAIEATWHGPTAFSCKAPAPPPTEGGRADGAAAPELKLALRDARAEQRPPAPDPALAQFCEYLAQAPLTKLTMRTCVSEAAYAEAFRRLPSLTELSVEYPRAPPLREDVQRLLAALAGNSGEGAVLEDLRVLRLRPVRYDGLDGDVAECLRIRRGACVGELEVDINTEACGVDVCDRV